MEKRTIHLKGLGSATFTAVNANSLDSSIKKLELVIDENLMDFADIRLVINGTSEIKVWSGTVDELSSFEELSQAIAVLIIITAGQDFKAENLNSTLENIQNKLPVDSLLLYSLINDESIKDEIILFSTSCQKND